MPKEKVTKSTPEGDNESKRNITWEINHALIRDSYVRLIKRLKRKPTYKEVSEHSDLSIKTIKKHIKELKFEPQKHPLRILSDDVLLSIASMSKKNAASQKLWMQICEGWTEKTITDIPGIEKIGELIITTRRTNDKKKSGN